MKEACYFANDRVRIKGRYINLFKIGWVKLLEPIKITGHLLSCTLKRHNGEDYVHLHFLCATEHQHNTPIKGTICGVDVGLKTPAVAVNDTGQVYILTFPLALREKEKRLKLLQKRLARKQYHSQRWKKQKRQLQKQQRDINNIRTDAINKYVNNLIKNHEIVVTEDLDCAAIHRRANRHMRRVLAHSCMSEILRKVERKSIKSVKAPRWYPSSKRCSKCGNIIETLDLSTRTYICAECGSVLDRDLNAAYNLLQLGAGSPGVLVEPDSLLNQSGAVHSTGYEKVQIMQPCQGNF